MNREIKFRAWDTKCKEMMFTGFHLMGEVMAFNMIEGYIFDHMEGASSSLERWNDIEVMQYTGLKDKNGKEIYEGDLIRDSDSDYIGEVIFDPETLCFTTRFQDNDLWGFVPQHGKDNHCEVIGDIWENKELLNEH